MDKKLSRASFAGRFFRDRQGNPWKTRDYQRKSLNSRQKRKVLRCGRDVGKTSEIEIVALHTAYYNDNKELLIAAPRENHLLPLMERIVDRAQQIYPEKQVKVKRSPSYRLTFPNGTVLWGRIAGHRGVNFQGMHADFVWVDEAQEFSNAAWSELLPAIKGKGSLWIYGVPNGVRNQFYNFTQMDLFQQFHWPATLNPDFSEERRQEMAALYGGENSPEYLHFILGEHGRPRLGVFDFDLYQTSKKDFANYLLFKITANDLPLHHLEDLLPFPRLSTPVYLGADLGYASDPTEIVGWHIDKGMMNPAFRIHLENVPYNLQIRIFEYLRQQINILGIGIDLGGNGLGVMHQLIEKDPEWERLISGINFGGWVTVSYSSDRPCREPAKKFMTTLLERRLQSGAINMPASDREREDQYINHTFQVSEQGRIVYSKGNDHIIDADRCAALCFNQNNLESDLDKDPGIIIQGC